MFWADNRTGSGGFHQHPMYNFGGYGVDLSPYLIDIQIQNAGSNSSSGSTWSVTVLIYKNGSLVATPGGQSTSNTMNVDDIAIGSELSSSGGAAALTEISHNQWLNGSGQFQYQTTTGTNPSTNPPPTNTG
jgi:hypothetical protein